MAPSRGQLICQQKKGVFVCLVYFFFTIELSKYQCFLSSSTFCQLLSLLFDVVWFDHYYIDNEHTCSFICDCARICALYGEIRI